MIDNLLNIWRANPDMDENIVAWRELPAWPAQYESFPDDLHPGLLDALRQRSISTLYTHQAQTWHHARDGHNPVVVTGTASGKTLAYNLPVLDRLLRDESARALYLFPTKALAQDQKDDLSQIIRSLRNFDDSSPFLQSSIPVAAYDGDTPADARPKIRKQAHLVISNPDMLHTGMLPHHTAWADFFSGLQFVVIDEMHSYRGVFGSHVANLIRRLKRVAQFYGAAPQFILTSATIANPTQLAETLIEEPIQLVSSDGSARAARHFLIYNPPIVNRDLGLRRGVLLEAVHLAHDLLNHGLQTIVFSRTRRSVELILSYLQQQHTGDRDQIHGYRSGYLPSQRRQIEQGLRDGSVRAVVATSALELGIDIGGMAAAVLAGYPGTIAQTWQQAGRAGRQSEESVAILVTSANPLDQYLAQHPHYFFDRSPEQALINPDHLLILLQHVRCAAFELPFRSGEGFGQVQPDHLVEYLNFLQEEGVLHHSGDRYFWMADHYPAQDVSLRSASPDTVILQVEQDGELHTLGTVDRGSADWMVHPQAIYLHAGQSYLIEDLDLDQGTASLRKTATTYYTEPHTQTSMQLIDKQAEADVTGATKSHGEILVTSQVTGYQKIKWFTHERIGTGEVDLPPSQLQTTGYWLTLTEETVESLRQQGSWTNDANDYGPNWESQRRQARARDGFRCQSCGIGEQGQSHHIHHKIPFRAFSSYQQANRLANLTTLCSRCHQRAEMAVRMRSGLAGLAFALGHLAPLSLMCDAHDLGVYADPRSPLAEGQPAVVIYDRIPAGIGFSQKIFELHDDLMNRAFDLVSTCECADGCPSCVGPAGENGAGGKGETLAMLDILCQL